MIQNEREPLLSLERENINEIGNHWQDENISEITSPFHDSSTESRSIYEQPLGLQRKITLMDGIIITITIIIGSGIFSSPGVVLLRSDCSIPLDLTSWILSGLITLFMSQCYIELGGLIPSSGADFSYLTEAYGEYIGFSFAWFMFFISKTGSQAILATIFTDYLLSATGSDWIDLNPSTTATLLSILVIVLITIINCIGLEISKILTKIILISKILLICYLFICAMIYPLQRHTFISSFSISSSSMTITAFFKQFIDWDFWYRIGAGMIACLWAFDGYSDTNTLMEELENPTKHLSMIITISLLLVTICYVLLNISYLLVLTCHEITDSDAIAVEFTEIITNQWKESSSSLQVILPKIVAVAVALSVLGALHGSILTGGRIFYVISREGKFPTCFAWLNTKGLPYIALIAQAIWSILLLLVSRSNFILLLHYVGPISWIYYALTTSSVIMFRCKKRNHIRPYRVFLHPLPSIIVIIFAIMILISSLQVEPLYTLLAIGLVVISFPFLFIVRNCYQS